MFESPILNKKSPKSALKNDFGTKIEGFFLDYDIFGWYSEYFALVWALENTYFDC